MNDPRWELVEALLATLFLAAGLLTAAASLGARPRHEAASFWFGIFCAMYGLRLAARSAAIGGLVAAPFVIFDAIDALVTYTILVPGTFVVESLVGRGWRGLAERTPISTSPWRRAIGS